jgi:hypothetical protein
MQQASISHPAQPHAASLYISATFPHAASLYLTATSPDVASLYLTPSTAISPHAASFYLTPSTAISPDVASLYLTPSTAIYPDAASLYLTTIHYVPTTVRPQFTVAAGGVIRAISAVILIFSVFYFYFHNFKNDIIRGQFTVICG